MKKIITVIFAIILLCLGTGAQTIQQKVKMAPPRPGGDLYTYIPFLVPPNTKSISIIFDFDKKGGANSLNFGLFEPGFTGKDSDKKGFRGYSGYVREAIFIAEDKATHGYRSGKISPGKWFVLIGLSKIAPEGVELSLKITFDQIDQKALKQYEAERSKRFTHDQFEKPKSIRINGLGWFRGDLHAHGFHGDGSWTVEGILESAASNGLDFVALTEHNTYTHHYEINAEKKNYPQLLVIRGEEVTTYGAHINVWGLPSGKWVDFRVLPGRQESAKQIADEAHKFGGLASINHPTMNCGGCSWTFGEDWGILDSVEIWNSTWDADDEKALKIWDGFLQRGRMITAIGSSDSHMPPYEPSPYPNNLRIGEPSVFIGARTLSEKSLFAGIKAGRVFIAENPRYSIRFTAGRHKSIGDRVTVRKKQKVNLRLSLDGFAPDAKVSWISDGKIIKESTPNSAENHPFSTDKENYVRIEIRNKDGRMLAMTNPIYFKIQKNAPEKR